MHTSKASGLKGLKFSRVLFVTSEDISSGGAFLYGSARTSIWCTTAQGRGLGGAGRVSILVMFRASDNSPAVESTISSPTSSPQAKVGSFHSSRGSKSSSEYEYVSVSVQQESSLFGVGAARFAGCGIRGWEGRGQPLPISTILARWFVAVRLPHDSSIHYHSSCCSHGRKRPPKTLLLTTPSRVAGDPASSMSPCGPEQKAPQERPKLWAQPLRLSQPAGHRGRDGSAAPAARPPDGQLVCAL